MRKFTQKEITGIARAFQTFMAACNGQRVRIQPHLEQVERALSAGITVDELLNFGNYNRAAALKPGANLADYVGMMVDGAIEVRSLKDEEDWDNAGMFIFIAEMFHDFYVEICAKGGTFGTPTAKSNLQKAIVRNSLQGIMNEATIRQVMDATALGDNLTCFKYIQELLINRESYDVDDSLTEEQEARRAAAPADFEPAAPEGVPHTGDTAEVGTEAAPQPDDESIHGDFDGFGEEEPLGEGAGAFVTMPAPREYKRARVIDAVNELTLDSLTKFMGLFDGDMSFDEFITALTDGDFDKGKEMTEEREVHQLLNGSLYVPFLECARWQGVEISEETASKMDLLTTNWDLRDDKTRKLQKIKELVYNHAVENSEDMDLMDVIADLEELYSQDGKIQK